MKPWRSRRCAPGPHSPLRICRSSAIASSPTARRFVFRRSLLLITCAAGCAGHRPPPAPPLAGPSSAPVMETPARVALITAPGDADWEPLGDEGTALLSQYIPINTTNPPGNEIMAARSLADVRPGGGIAARGS